MKKEQSTMNNPNSPSPLLNRAEPALHGNIFCATRF
jgi:hypothetical protein